MSWFNIAPAVKPMFRNLGNGRVLEYCNLGNGITKSRILENGQEVLKRTAKVNKQTGERLISTVETSLHNNNGIFVPSSERFFTHIKSNSIYNETGNLLKRKKLIEKGFANPSITKGFCRTSDVSLVSQDLNGCVSEIKCTLPNFEYTRNLNTSPTIFSFT